MPTPSALPRDEARPAGCGELRVLIVEENEINARLARHILEKLGCAVDLAVNGAEGVRMQAQGRYDAVFMDCQMPVMDGFEAAQRIRAQTAPDAQPPIIAVTANVRPADRDRCLAAGMDDFIAKPFHPNDFLQALTRWCGSPSPCLA